METTRIKWEPPRDDFYKARIKTLEKENLELRRKLDKEEEAYEYGDEMSKAVIAELENQVAELQRRCNELEAFKEKIVKAVIA